MSIRSICNKTARVERAKTSGVTQTATGGASRTWTVIHRDVRCRLQPLSSELQAKAAAAGIRTTHEMRTPTNLALQANDRVIVAGTTYRVRGWQDAAGAGKLFSGMLEVE